MSRVFLKRLTKARSRIGAAETRVARTGQTDAVHAPFRSDDVRFFEAIISRRLSAEFVDDVQRENRYERAFQTVSAARARDVVHAECWRFGGKAEEPVAPFPVSTEKYPKFFEPRN